ncbi:MAG: hypothetical protein HY897_06745 [Deltaproteobacteria bacterium]|nr:hypothetical protein [Deltaproteobacteria bacterium]
MKRFVYLVLCLTVLVLSLMACGSGGSAAAGADTGGTDKCAGIKCSGHGKCALVEGEPACACDEGFFAQGFNCVTEGTGGDAGAGTDGGSGDKCDGVDCSAHGLCALLEGAPACVCDKGYFAEGLGCLPLGGDAGMKDAGGVDTGSDAGQDTGGWDTGTGDDAGGAVDASVCATFGDQCGVSGGVDYGTCCDGACAPIGKRCCHEPAGSCDPGSLALYNHGCCEGSWCDDATTKCVVATCYPSSAPGSGGPGCKQAGFPELPCCDTGFVCIEDPIYGFLCCAPAGVVVPVDKTWVCCSGSAEIKGNIASCM